MIHRAMKLRKALAKCFLPQEIARLQPMITQRVEELLDGFRGAVGWISSRRSPLRCRRA